jgi:hypothetical protein
MAWREIINEALDFMKTGEAHSIGLRELVESFGPAEMRAACSSLLNWMGSQKRLERLYPLRLQNSEMDKVLAKMICCHGFWKEILEVEATERVVFASTLTQEQKSEIAAYVNDAYKPPLFVSRG